MAPFNFRSFWRFRSKPDVRAIAAFRPPLVCPVLGAKSEETAGSIEPSPKRLSLLKASTANDAHRAQTRHSAA